VRRVVFLDHLHAGAAVLGDLIDVCAFHQAQADIRMPQAVCCAVALRGRNEVFLIEDGFKKLALPPGKLGP
jgi:hypothetical protein